MAACTSAQTAPEVVAPLMEPDPISLMDLRAKYEIPGSRYIDLNGVELHYADEGSGPPVVLLHASFLNFRAWDVAAAELVANGYRVIRPDFPSLGLSGIDGAALSGEKVVLFDRNAEIVAKLIEALELGPVRLVGTSSGGAAAFRTASAHPELIEQLVLINSAGLPRTRQSDPNRLREEEQAWARMAVKPDAYWQVVFDRNFVPPNTPPQWLVTLAYDVNRRAEQPPPGRYDFSSGDPEAILAGVQAPTMIGWGMNNATVLHLDAEVFAYWMTGAPTVIRKYDGLGHYPYIEQPEPVLRDILAFFSGALDGELRQTQRLPPSQTQGQTQGQTQDQTQGQTQGLPHEDTP